MPPYPLTNFEIQKYYKNETRFNVFTRNNLFKKIKDGVYIINLDEYADIGTHWIALFCKKKKKKRNCLFYSFFEKLQWKLYSFVVEHIPEEIKEFIGNKNTKANIFRVQENDAVMCGYFCIGFIDFMFAGKKLTDYTNLPYDF